MENCGNFDFSTSKHLFEDFEKKNTVYTFLWVPHQWLGSDVLGILDHLHKIAF